MKNVIEELLDKQMCFAVCVGINSMKNKAISNSTRDYFVIVNECDAETKEESAIWIHGIKFSRSPNYKDVFTKTLSARDINYFKGNQCLFIKKEHSKDGRIYELVGKSFKEHYETTRPMSL